MKFACPKCNTRYSIADEKVPAGKILKFPCKSCAHVIRLRRKEVGESAPPPPKPLDEPLAPTGETTRVASLTELDELRGAASRESAPARPVLSAATKVASPEEMSALRSAAGLGAAPSPMPSTSEATKVASPEEMDALRNAAARSAAPSASQADEANGAEDTSGDAAEAAFGDDQEEWYVLIAGKQKGPMTALAVKELLDQQEIDKRTFIWRGGMANWERLATVEPFKSAAENAGHASWRVVKPLDDGPTTAQETREAVATAQALELDEPTAAMDAGALAQQLAQAQRTDEVQVAPKERFYKAETQVASDPRLVAALAGVPTGESMRRDPAEQQPTREDVLANISDAIGEHAESRPALEPFSARATVEARRSTDTFLGRAGARAEDPLSPLHDSNEEALRSFDDGFTGELGTSQEAAAKSSDEDYLEAPPGEATRVFMATAGIYKRRRQHRIAAVLGTTFTIAFVGIIAMDIMGFIEIPGMGLMYDVTGFQDPNVSRALERAENKLAEGDLDPKRRAELEALRRKLLGLGTEPGTVKPRKSGGTTALHQPGQTQGVVETQKMDNKQRELAQNIFSDTRKQEANVKLADPTSIQTPNLPDGLTQEAIFKVIQENNGSMKLCFAEAARKGEKLAGKMEVQLTIDATGSVTAADITTSQFRGSAMGTCTVKRVKSWKFPRFNGEPVTVVFPYVLQMGL